MTRLQKLLLVAIIIEVATLFYLFAFVLVSPSGQSPIPLPDVSRLDTITASAFRNLHANCNPRSAADLSLLAEKYFVSGFHPEANACYRRASELEPNNGNLLFNWAFCLAHSGQTAESTALFLKAIDRKAVRQDGAWYFIGRNHLREQNVAAAREAFEKISRLPASQYQLAKLLVREGNAKEALPSLQRLCARHPTAPEYWYLAARAYDQVGDTHKARVSRMQAFWARQRPPSPFEPQSQKTHAIFNSFGAARLMAAMQNAWSQQDSARAESLARQLLDAGADPGLLSFLTEIQAHRRQGDSEIRAANRAIEQNGPSFDFLRQLGDAQARVGFLARAEDTWDKALQMGQGRHVDLAPLHDEIARFFLEARQDTAAAKRHRTAAQLHGALSGLDEGYYAAAESMLKQVVQQDPDNAMAWYYLGESIRLQSANHFAVPKPSAKSAYERCLRIDPNFGRAREALKLWTP